LAEKNYHLENIEKIFTEIGGQFQTAPAEISKKLKSVRAFIFDWDGVFNNGEKVEGGSSVFSEVDSMGTNLLRFSHWLQYKQLPFTAVISGERNAAAFWFSNREHFSTNYYKVANKIEALDHFCKLHSLKHEEIAYVWDDVLDLSIAQVAGVSIAVGRKAAALFMKHVKENKLADYITGSHSGNFAVREACELIMGLRGVYDETISKRSAYGHIYREYADARNKVVTEFFTKGEKHIIAQDPKS
jgi:3-deoxy-D-manno-octulosonate 8-phosphate phosphatase (KDO 8-P phosphatase)